MKKNFSPKLFLGMIIMEMMNISRAERFEIRKGT